MNTRSVKTLMDLKGRVALLTGAAGHIGAAMGESLAELGADLVLLDVAQDACREAAGQMRSKFGIRSIPLPIDLADENAVRAVPRLVMDQMGRLDILINNAALVGTSELKGWATPLAEQSADTWRLALAVNLTAPFVLTQACAPMLTASGHGSVINIGSIYGIVGPDKGLYTGTKLGNPAAYAASKGGLLQLTRWLATVLAPDVRVNAITVGGVWRNQPEDFHQRYREKTPLNRMAVEEDVKGAVAFLASDLSAYVTGHNLVVDGGWTIW